VSFSVCVQPLEQRVTCHEDTRRTLGKEPFSVAVSVATRGHFLAFAGIECGPRASPVSSAGTLWQRLAVAVTESPFRTTFHTLPLHVLRREFTFKTCVLEQIRIHRILHPAFRHAVEWMLLFVNPLESVKPPRWERKEQVWLDLLASHSAPARAKISRSIPPQVIANVSAK
jgi:hypothetical protein